MPRKPKPKCEHGNSLVYVTGCPTCCMNALFGINFLRDNKLTRESLWRMLQTAFPTKEKWDAAVSAATVAIEQENADAMLAERTKTHA